MPDHPRICLVSPSGANVFFTEIVEAFGGALREQGVVVEESVDCFPPPAPDLVYLFIPHEYRLLVHEKAQPTEEQLRRTVALNTEQPGTSWFELSAEIAAAAGAVVDLNEVGARELRRRGIAAERAPLGYVPAWDAWGRRDGVDRPVDVCFLGAHTERRARLLARCAPLLAERRAEIRLTETERPHLRGSPAFVSGAPRSQLLARTRLLLNVHQQDLAYLEWHRILSAVLNGCVVLSEHSLWTSPLVPGEHYVSAGYDDLPFVLEGLLDDPDRLDSLRGAAYDLVREQMPMVRAAEAVLTAAERVAAEPVSGSRTPSLPQPQPLPDRKPEWEGSAERAGEQLPLRRALRHLVVRIGALERRLDEAHLDGPVPHTVESFGPSGGPPQVSVLLTVHNHADLVGDALRSVALCDLREVEVVVVDDGSTDGSAEAIRLACAELPWLSGRLVQRSLNSRLPAVARNLALEHARAELVFVLDADNSVFPAGPGRLARAMEPAPDVAFAYGLLQAFDVTGPVGLRSWLGWDPARLRYGNYVDAMAMIRRSALDAVGGYPTDDVLAGWEDFALWAAMADAGMQGLRVPEFVGRYRVSRYSMSSLIDIDHSAAWETLLRKYPVLSQGSSR